MGISQTSYSKIKLSQDKITKHIKVFFITLDEDKTLSVRKKLAKKDRTIVEVNTDGSYILSEDEIKEESNKVKKFDKFISDSKSLTDS